MDTPVVLFRSSLAEEGELAICSQYFPAYQSRVEIPRDSLVIGRYSVLPYYEELDYDLETGYNASLINNYAQHLFLANIERWYLYFEDITAKTWTRLIDMEGDGPFVLKGNTNSRKNLWSTHMYAKNHHDAIKVYCNLQQDSLIDPQGIVIRQFEEYETYTHGVNGQPIIHEFRLFFYKGKLLSRGFYWGNFIDEIGYTPSGNDIPDEFIDNLSSRMNSFMGEGFPNLWNANFWVADIALRKDGQWRLIELNDGQMSGLSCNDPHILYGNLKKVLGNEKLY